MKYSVIVPEALVTAIVTLSSCLSQCCKMKSVYELAILLFLLACNYVIHVYQTREGVFRQISKH